MIRLENNRRALYQWQQNQRVIVDGYPAGTRVEFSVRYDCKESALPVLAYEEDGHVYAPIPNILLQKAGYIRVCVNPSAIVEQKPQEKDLKVIRREKPENYEYIETPLITIEKDVQRIAEECLKKINPVKTVNGVSPDENGNVEVEGNNGATFTPSVSPDGVISWTNDKGLDNPESVNIKGGDGVGILSVEQVTTSTEDNGKNIVKVTLTNGKEYTFAVQNGSKGKAFTYADFTAEQLESLKGGKGDDGVGIKSIEQTTTSTEDGGINVFTVSLTNGNKATFDVRNGKSGYTPQKGVDYYTEAEKTEMSRAVFDEAVGDINTALDNIIAIQEELLIPNGDEVSY